MGLTLTEKILREHTIEIKHFTYDLERLMYGAVKRSTSKFANVIIDGL